MKKIIAYVLCIPALLYITSCDFLNKNPSNLWFFTYSAGERKDDSLTPASFLYLQKDGSYTCDFGKFEYGHREFKNQDLTLKNIDEEVTVLPVKYLGYKELKLNTGEDAVANFEASPLQISSEAENPFSLENNKWRTSAEQKETIQQIKERLKNHCKFREIYFTWALNNNISTVDVRSTPTPIKIYGNGFTLKPFEELPPAWRSYFYDTDDCKQANDILEAVFTNGNIAWAHTDNKYKMFIAAFQQLEQQIK